MPDKELEDRLEGLFSDLLDDEPTIMAEFDPVPEQPPATEPALEPERPDTLAKQPQTVEPIMPPRLSQPTGLEEPRPEQLDTLSRRPETVEPVAVPRLSRSSQLEEPQPDQPDTNTRQSQTAGTIPASRLSQPNGRKVLQPEQQNSGTLAPEAIEPVAVPRLSQPAPLNTPQLAAAREDYPQSGVNWRLMIWLVLLTVAAVILVFFGQTLVFRSSDEQLANSEPRFVIPLSPTPSNTPQATPTAEEIITFIEPTATMTPQPGGRILNLNPALEAVGWVVSDEADQDIESRPNHFGELFLYAGMVNEQNYHAAFQFSLDEIPRGSQIHAATLRLAGLRSDQLSPTGEGTWQVHLLGPEGDYHWRDQSYEQIHQADVLSTLKPALTQADLGDDRENLFEFSSEQLRLLEQRVLEGSDQYGKLVSFRIDGPTEGDTTNLFAWDSGNGLASRGAGPELRLSIGPPPRETPPPYYVVVTSTPTPESIVTAVAISARMTSRAAEFGTATPLPPYWVTPRVVTATPTAENQATAQVLRRLATAVAMTTGQPPNLEIVTVTPSPTYIIITSTPTADEISTAVAHAQQATAMASRVGTATPLPSNWVTPLVVTSTPVPENQATVAYHRAVVLTTGTPTPLPSNVQTATATPIAVAVQPLASPTLTATPSPTPQAIPSSLMGKIIFLSDREGATEEERERADRLGVTPQVTPQPYIFDPATGQLEKLTARWPYDVAVARDGWSADTAYETYAQQLLWTNVEVKQGDGSTKRQATEVIAIHFYDHIYGVERAVTEFGTGIAYDPAWSPVSNEIAFVATESGNDEIWTIRHDGTEVRQLTRNDWEWDKHPSWSPDGQQLVFFSNRTGTSQIWIMNKDGSEQRPLMEGNPYNDFNPVWIKYLEPAPPLVRQPDWRFTKPPE